MLRRRMEKTHQSRRERITRGTMTKTARKEELTMRSQENGHWNWKIDSRYEMKAYAPKIDDITAADSSIIHKVI